MLELSYYRHKLPFTIHSKFLLSVHEVKEPCPEKWANKRQKKIVVITLSPCKNELEMKRKERMINVQERMKKIEEQNVL